SSLLASQGRRPHRTRRGSSRAGRAPPAAPPPSARRRAPRRRGPPRRRAPARVRNDAWTEPVFRSALDSFVISRKAACSGGSELAGVAALRRIVGAAMIRVVVAEDAYLVREGIRRLLETEQDIDLVAACEDLPSLLEAIEAERPDVVLTA